MSVLPEIADNKLVKPIHNFLLILAMTIRFNLVIHGHGYESFSKLANRFGKSFWYMV